MVSSIKRTESLGTRFETLAQLAYELQESFDVTLLAKRIVEGACRLGFRRARLYLLDQQRQTLVGQAASGEPLPVEFVGYEVSLNAGPIIQHIFASDSVTIWNKAEVEHVFGGDCTEPWMTELDLHDTTWIDCALVVGSERIGTLSVDNHARQDGFTEDESAVLGVLASLAAHTLNNARLYHKERLVNASLRSVLDEAPDAVVTTDLHGVIEFASRSTERVTGYTPARIVGQPAASFYVGPTGDAESGLRVAQEIMATLREWGIISNRLVYIRDPDDRPRPILLSVSFLHSDEPKEAGTPARPNRIGTLGFIKDTSPTGIQAHQYRDVLEGFGYGTVLLNDDGVVVFANAKAARLLGRTSDVAIGRRFAEMVVLSERAGFEGALRGVDTGEREASLDLALLWPDGSVMPVKCHVNRIRFEDGARGVSLGLYGTREVAALTQSASLMALGQMVAGVAHEINNPLNNLLTAKRDIDAALEGQCTERVADALDIIERNAERVAATVRQLREFGRPRAFDPRSVSMVDVVREALKFVANRLRNANVRIREAYASDLHRVFVDSTRLQQVIINLLINAEEAMERQDERTILIVLENDEGHVSLTVEDSGPGVPEHVRDSLFDPFFTTKGAARGTGLGLSVSKLIIEHHEGTIELVEPGTLGGASFRIRLPRESADDPGADA
jgi:PAS domain S-box-containing protein